MPWERRWAPWTRLDRGVGGSTRALPQYRPPGDRRSGTAGWPGYPKGGARPADAAARFQHRRCADPRCRPGEPGPTDKRARRANLGASGCHVNPTNTAGGRSGSPGRASPSLTPAPVGRGSPRRRRYAVPTPPMRRSTVSAGRARPYRQPDPAGEPWHVGLPRQSDEHRRRTFRQSRSGKPVANTGPRVQGWASARRRCRETPDPAIPRCRTGPAVRRGRWTDQRTLRNAHNPMTRSSVAGASAVTAGLRPSSSPMYPEIWLIR
ncbi:hypothetical protein BMS3Abin12_01271 [bacterium BMS3Abin12]|nr:hypothetical protein BMS3Abin12_01271 [bacterium BMS3Abin12]